MLILKVDGRVHERTAVTKDKAEFTIRFQEAEIIRQNRRPRLVEIVIGGRPRYAEGLYTLTSESFRPDRFERLEMAYPTLIPLKEALEVAEKENKALRKAGRPG